MRRSTCIDASASVRARLGLETGDRDGLVGEGRPAVGACGEGVLEPGRIVALGEVLAVVRAAALGAGERRMDGRFGAVEQVPHLARVEEVRVEDRAAVLY